MTRQITYCGSIAAVPAHETPEGERPIAFGFKTLTKSERIYATIDKEAKAIIFGITKFYDYLYGREFLLKTDHDPLVRIFGPKKGIPTMAARRLQRYANFLSTFTFKIEYVKSKDNCANGLSRLPIPREKEKNNKKEFTHLNYVELQEFTSFERKAVARETRKEKNLSQVARYMKEGWPNGKMINDELKVFESRKDELTMEQDCIMW